MQWIQAAICRFIRNLKTVDGGNYMETIYSERILNTKKSFIREMLKAAGDDTVISFAGGLPNPISFPQKELQESINRVIEEEGAKAFQYATTEGLYQLREYIAKRYECKHHLQVEADDILITTGSQQGLDLMGKVLLNKGDKVLLEKPSYLGAIQAFSLYEPEFIQVDLNNDGLDMTQLEMELEKQPIKLMYTVPNFQNPTGLTYSMENRKEIGKSLSGCSTILIQDDPYGDLIFEGESFPYIEREEMENNVLFGSFSKILTPGMRIGWLCTKNKELMSHLVTAKQASDLHTNIFAQFVINDYLKNNDVDKHIMKIRNLYKEQCNAMLNAIGKYFPKEVKVTKPIGGMFIWATLPNGKSAMELFNKASEKKITFVPGDPFYTTGITCSTMRLNYTNADSETIEEGIKRLASVM